MATLPSVYPEWATNDEQQTVDLEGDGNLVTVDNKVEPTVEWKASGEKFQENLPRQYVNYQFDLLNDWIMYLREGQIGDYRLVAQTETSLTMAARYTGTWFDHGTDTFAGQTLRLFEKTA